MKRVGNLYEKILDRDLIHAAICEAGRGKRNRESVKLVMADIPGHVEKIREMLINDTYTPAPYHVFERYDPHSKKTRKIQRPEFFPDQVVHWLIILACQKVFMRGMDYWCCGSVPNRGIKRGYDGVRRWLRDDKKNTKYTLKMDIRKYYDSVPHHKLMAIMHRKIKDPRMLSLIQKIVDTTEVGIPIGNYTSQWFANLFLESLDHYIREKLKAKHYVRYIDDMVLFSNNKKELHKTRKLIEKYMKDELGLELKDNWQVFKTDSRGVDFLGFVFHRTHIRLRARNFLAFIRQCAVIKKLMALKMSIPFKIAAGLISRLGQLKYFDSFLVKSKYFLGIKLKQLKKVVSNESKRQSAARAVLA
jgi:RNA-directed DNA polymerase